MPAAEPFVSEFHAKNQASLERLIAPFRAALEKEAPQVADLVRLAMKDAIELAEVAALWFVDADGLEAKLGFSEQCGDAARHVRALAARLAGLGVDPFDPRTGGYSRSFGFLRTLQTPEERASAGLVTMRSFLLTRLAVFGELAEGRGDADTAALFRESLSADHRRVFDVGWRALLAAAANEESQARARRAAFRIVELAGDAVEPLFIRKSLPRRRTPAAE